MEKVKYCTVESVMEGIKGFGEACIKEAQTLDEIIKNSDFIQSSTKRLKQCADDSYIVEYSVKCTMRFIDLLNTLSQGKELPKKIVYDDIIYTNVSRTKMNLLYYCIEKDDSTYSIFKEAMFARKPGETDIDILNREIGVIEW